LRDQWWVLAAACAAAVDEAPCLRIGGCPAFPLFGLDGPHAMAYSLIQIVPDPWSIRQPEVDFQFQHVAPQLFDQLIQTVPAGFAGQFPDSLLECRYGLRGRVAFGLAASCHPEAVAQKFAPEHAG
jgi:hypothetical protein